MTRAVLKMIEEEEEEEEGHAPTGTRAVLKMIEEEEEEEEGHAPTGTRAALTPPPAQELSTPATGTRPVREREPGRERTRGGDRRSKKSSRDRGRQQRADELDRHAGLCLGGDEKSVVAAGDEVVVVVLVVFVVGLVGPAGEGIDARGEGGEEVVVEGCGAGAFGVL